MENFKEKEILVTGPNCGLTPWVSSLNWIIAGSRNVEGRIGPRAGGCPYVP
jgi:hypothetical protein